MKRPLDQLAEIAQRAVLIGNDLIKNVRPQSVTEKSDRDVYTNVDLQIEHEVRTYLAEVTPDISFFGEEEGTDDRATEGGLTWTLDPIDGTTNYVHGIPLCGVSLALIEDDRAVVAAITLPYFNLDYSASQKNGAYVNGKRITVSTTNKLSSSVIAIGDYAIGAGAEDKNKRRIAVTAALAARAERIRMFGSAAHDLAWTAEGRIDGAVILSNQTHDMAAGVLIARESGALVIDSNGEEHTTASRHTIAATPQIAEQLLALVQANL